MYRYDTRLLTCFQQLNRLTLLMPVVLLLAFGLSIADLNAQSSATPKNVYSPLVTETYPGVAVTTGSGGAVVGNWASTGNVINSNLNDFAQFNIVLALAGSGWIQVTDKLGRAHV